MKIHNLDAFKKETSTLTIEARGIETSIPMEELLLFIKTKNLDGLWFSEYMIGKFELLDFSFLYEVMPNAHHLRVLTSHNEGNYQFITNFKNLSRLALSGHNGKIVFDYEQFTHLKIFSAKWYDDYFLILNANKKLEEIWIEDFSHPDLTLLPELPHLKNLRIQGSTLKNLVGLEKFPNLQQLQIYDSKTIFSLRGIEKSRQIECFCLANLPKLQNLSGMEKLSKLERLEIDKCSKVNDLSFLATNVEIKELFFDNLKLDSLKPLERLLKLKWLLLSEGTKIMDNDLSLRDKIMN